MMSTGSAQLNDWHRAELMTRSVLIVSFGENGKELLINKLQQCMTALSREHIIRSDHQACRCFFSMCIICAMGFYEWAIHVQLFLQWNRVWIQNDRSTQLTRHFSFLARNIKYDIISESATLSHIYLFIICFSSSVSSCNRGSCFRCVFSSLFVLIYIVLNLKNSKRRFISIHPVHSRKSVLRRV